MTENEISKIVVDAAVKLHQDLGPGLLESVYETALAYLLLKRGLSCVRQHPIPFQYDGLEFDEGFRADIVVNDLVILELKSVENIAPVHRKQIQTYIRLADKKLGLLLNFGAPLMRDGIVRAVNNLPEQLSRKAAKFFRSKKIQNPFFLCVSAPLREKIFISSPCSTPRTKRRIDTARDILVGKVPDPKSQVEQITIALIYKFIVRQNTDKSGYSTLTPDDKSRMAKNFKGYDISPAKATASPSSRWKTTATASVSSAGPWRANN